MNCDSHDRRGTANLATPDPAPGSDDKVSRTFRRLDPQRQLAIIEALLIDAAEHGTHAISVKRVATRAGVSVGSLYQYFPHREGMLGFAAEICSGFLTTSLNAYRPHMAALPLREGLLMYLTAGVEWSRGYATLLSFFARAAYQGIPGFGDLLVKPVATAMRGLLEALLNGAHQRGELRSGLDVSTAVRLIHALTINLGDAQLLPYLNDYLQLFDDSRQPEAVCQAAVDFILNAIAVETQTT
jgi:AcrR family transcriptional regulator